MTTLDDIELDNYYTLWFVEGFGSKMTLVTNAKCVFKNDNGAGFGHLFEGYHFIPTDKLDTVRGHIKELSFHALNEEAE